MDELGIIRAGVPYMDECPILSRTSAFIVAQGSVPVLEHAFRSRSGSRIDLRPYLGSVLSESSSVSSSATLSGDMNVKLRVKEWIAGGYNPIKNPIWTTAGYAEDASRGILRAPLLPAITEHPGIYELSWGIFNPAGNLLAANQAMLSVERSLFPANPSTLYDVGGPMTLGEIRTWIMDNRETNILLDNIEFSDAQLMQAIADPVRQWNESPPPLRPTFTTRTFPFRNAWLTAITGRLHIIAANHYRRNFLPAQAGGLSVPDKGKEQEYMAEGTRLGNEYTSWLRDKKVSINMRNATGYSSSLYASRQGW